MSRKRMSAIGHKRSWSASANIYTPTQLFSVKDFALKCLWCSARIIKVFGNGIQFFDYFRVNFLFCHLRCDSIILSFFDI